jgi:hypothetical protein
MYSKTLQSSAHAFGSEPYGLIQQLIEGRPLQCPDAQFRKDFLLANSQM